jgi:hypothetical protein
LVFIIDGAKALSAAVIAVFGVNAVIEHSTVHKRRNVAEHLPEDNHTRPRRHRRPSLARAVRRFRIGRQRPSTASEDRGS